MYQTSVQPGSNQKPINLSIAKPSYLVGHSSIGDIEAVEIMCLAE